MAVTRHAGNLLVGTESERNALSTTNMLTSTRFYETDTERTVRWSGTAWIFPEAFFEAPTWLIYKQGSNYKAKSGYLGYAPTSAISTSLNSVWNYITGSASQFHQGAPDGATTGGSIVFGKGKFTFTETPWPNSINNTWAGSFGIHLLGQGQTATWVEFTPSVQKEAAFELKNIQYSSIRNMFIRVNDFVTNAIKINADTISTTNNKVESVLIDNSGGDPAFLDQRGIYIYGNGSIDTFFTIIRDVYMRYMYHGIEVAGPSTNNAGHTYSNINFWRSEKGITLGSACSLYNINNIQHQGVSTSVGIYTISIGDGALQNNISNVWADAIDKTGAAVVVLGYRTRFNNITNVINNSGHLILDNSGNITNNYTNLIGFGHPSIQNRGRQGRWYAGGNNIGDGFLGSVLTSHTSGSATVIRQFNVDHGSCADYILSATASSQCGFFGASALVTRRMAPIFYARFKTNSTGDFRLFICLTNEIVAPVYANIGDTYKNDKACIGLIIQSVAGDATRLYKYFTGDMTGTPTVGNILNTAGGTIAIDAAATPHELWIKGDPVNARWLLSLDSNTPMIFNVSAEIPGADDTLTPLVLMQWVSGTARVMTLFDMRLSSQT